MERHSPRLAERRGHRRASGPRRCRGASRACHRLSRSHRRRSRPAWKSRYRPGHGPAGRGRGRRLSGRARRHAHRDLRRRCGRPSQRTLRSSRARGVRILPRRRDGTAAARRGESRFRDRGDACVSTSRRHDLEQLSRPPAILRRHVGGGGLGEGACLSGEEPDELPRVLSAPRSDLRQRVSPGGGSFGRKGMEIARRAGAGEARARTGPSARHSLHVRSGLRCLSRRGARLVPASRVAKRISLRPPAGAPGNDRTRVAAARRGAFDRPLVRPASPRRRGPGLWRSLSLGDEERRLSPGVLGARESRSRSGDHRLDLGREGSRSVRGFSRERSGGPHTPRDGGSVRGPRRGTRAERWSAIASRRAQVALGSVHRLQWKRDAVADGVERRRASFPGRVRLPPGPLLRRLLSVAGVERYLPLARPRNRADFLESASALDFRGDGLELRSRPARRSSRSFHPRVCASAPSGQRPAHVPAPETLDRPLSSLSRESRALDRYTRGSSGHGGGPRRGARSLPPRFPRSRDLDRAASGGDVRGRGLLSPSRRGRTPERRRHSPSRKRRGARSSDFSRKSPSSRSSLPRDSFPARASSQTEPRTLSSRSAATFTTGILSSSRPRQSSWSTFRSSRRFGARWGTP